MHRKCENFHFFIHGSFDWHIQQMLTEHLLGTRRRKMKGEKTWLQPSRCSLVGMSNTVTGNEGEMESLEGAT